MIMIIFFREDVCSVRFLLYLQKYFDFTRKCLSFSLMNLGNSLQVREDEPCREFVYAIGVYEHSVGCCFFSLPQLS